MALLLSTSLLCLSVILKNGVQAQTAPTWPAPANDELEDIMFLNSGYRAVNFNKAVTPCSAAPSGTVGRIASAEWLRTAFHDMASYNQNSGTDGIDGSLAYELTPIGARIPGENIGLGFNTSLLTYEPFMGPRVSMADMIAMGTYTSVRACGGPVIPIKYGRVDALKAGGGGVPQISDGANVFSSRFSRMGFTSSEMIILVACGHTLGGVHASNFPGQIFPTGICANDYCPMDSTTAAFDEKIASEYVSNTTNNPLVNGTYAVQYKRNTDFIVNNIDGNATIKTLADPTTFRNTCQTYLQKMIEKVPKSVQLSANPIVPYEAKPYNLQLYLADGGQTLNFTGEVRIRMTKRAAISSVKLAYKDRTGGSNCNGCSISTQSVGTASGFDDTFAFYGFSASLPSSTSISSFTVVITYVSGSTETLDNNGAGFPIQDTLLFQPAQSCSTSSSSLTVLAAVRNTTSGTPNLNVVSKYYISNIPTATFKYSSAAMVGSTTPVGAYNLYNLTVSLNATTSSSARFNVTLGQYAVDLQYLAKQANTCGTLSASTPVTTPSTSKYLGCYLDSTSSRTLSAARFYDTQNLTIESCAALCNTYNYFGMEYSQECYCGNVKPGASLLKPDTDCNMPCTGNSQQTCGAGDRLSTYTNLNYKPALTPNEGAYLYQGCFNDSQTARSLSASRLVDDAMTIEKCAAFCASGNYVYFGTEYASECYCGNTIASTSILAPTTDCSMVCAGNSSEACGGADRMNLWSSANSTKTKRHVREFIPHRRSLLFN